MTPAAPSLDADSYAPMVKNVARPLDVLVVDDELLIRWSLSEALSEAGHSVKEAVDRASAIEALKADPKPDVVLLDFRLPDSNDLGLLAAIRQTAPDAQVIMMTAFGTAEMTKAALDMGAYRVVSKPFEVHDLAVLVVEAYEARQS